VGVYIKGVVLCKGAIVEVVLVLLGQVIQDQR